MYQCFHCLANAVIWDSDFTFEDCGYEGEGSVTIGIIYEIGRHMT